MAKQIKISDIIPLIAQDKSNSQIAKVFEVSTPTIARWVRLLKDAGVEVPKRKKGVKRTLII